MARCPGAPAAIASASAPVVPPATAAGSTGVVPTVPAAPNVAWTAGVAAGGARWAVAPDMRRPSSAACPITAAKIAVRTTTVPANRSARVRRRGPRIVDRLAQNANTPRTHTIAPIERYPTVTTARATLTRPDSTAVVTSARRRASGALRKVARGLAGSTRVLVRILPTVRPRQDRKVAWYPNWISGIASSAPVRGRTKTLHSREATVV